MLEKEYVTTVNEPSGSGWKPFAAKWCARSAAARGCGPKPGGVRVAGMAIHEVTAMTVAAGSSAG